MSKRHKPGSIGQKRESALAHRIEACEIRAALRSMTPTERAAWRMAARIHESLVRDYMRDLRAMGAST